METLRTNNSLPIHHHHPASNYDEISMQQSLLFSDSLQDLKNLRTQLYSAAEYFELSYTNDDQKELVVETLKDYAIRALVNTVDHLGSVTYKVNDILDEKVEEISGTEFRVSCIEQRLKTCQEYIDREGMAQQSSVLDTPRYHKRYVLPAGQTVKGSNNANLKYKGCGNDEDDWLQFRSEEEGQHHLVADLPGYLAHFPSQPPRQEKNKIKDQFHRTDFRFCVRDLLRQDQPHQSPVGQQLQILLLKNNGMLKSLGNQSLCEFMTRSRSQKTSKDNPAKVSACSRHCLADESRRKMRCCILIWMNIEGKLENLASVEVVQNPKWRIELFISLTLIIPRK